jgi:hypothetical protein
MHNPFEKRATEYLRDDVAFLAVVTPEPLVTFFSQPATEDRLYDRLVTVIGTPGSGKTTLARLFQYPTLCTLLRNQGYRPLADAMRMCQAVQEEDPIIAGCRIPLEAEYRDIWELPYPDDLRINLMLTLLQSRAVLGWLRNLQNGGVPLENIDIVPREDADAATASIGGTDPKSVLSRAQQVEAVIYEITAALIPEEIGLLDLKSVAAYRPLDVIKEFHVHREGSVLSLRPLVIFDDAHNLHPAQLASLRKWLVRRELRVARWILMRLDALTPEEVLARTNGISGVIRDEEPGVKRTRETTEIHLQSNDDRGGQRRTFRKMAKDMANRYLGQMDVFSRHRLNNLGDLLNVEPEAISTSQLEALRKSVNATQARLGISREWRNRLETEVEQYMQGAVKQDGGDDVRLAMVKILLERYGKRVPQGRLFGGDEDAEPSRPLTADSNIADGAKIHLLHKYDRPYYFGIDMLCDASSENAEQFLQLAARLVSHSETQIIRGRPSVISARVQHQLLRERAKKIFDDWDFPQYRLVQRFVDGLAKQCLEKSVEPNASLGGGATAFGIPQEEFLQIPTKHKDLAGVIQFGIAYNALNLVRDYQTKHKTWCLVELGGILLVRNGLTLRRGGFLERRVDDLLALLGSG